MWQRTKEHQTVNNAETTAHTLKKKMRREETAQVLNQRGGHN